MAEPLAQLLIKFWPYHQLLNEKCLFSPVPLHWRRKNWRGFNQAQLIAKYLKVR
jgi:predicted amidophosphoribosyltransferase